MLETGNFVDIRYGKEARYKKPVGIYWLQSATTVIADGLTGAPRNAIWTYRLASLAGAYAAVAGTFWCATALLSAEGAFLAALLMGATLLLSAEAKIAKTDAVLLATVVWTQGALLRIYLAARAGTPSSFALAMAGWFAFAVGVLIKGPVILGVVAATFVPLCIWDRQWRWLGRIRPLAGLGLTVLLVLPWVAAIWIASHGQFFQQSLGTDFSQKLVGGQETHGFPPGYYFLLATLSFWPATLFLLPGLGAAIARRTEPAMRFLLCWAAGFYVIVEAVPTKLPHYVMPVYPALAILAAAWVSAPREDGLPLWRRILFWLAPLQFAVAVGGFAWLLVWAPETYGAGAPAWLMGGAGVSVVLGLAAAGLFVWRKPGWGAGLGCACALGFYGLMTLAVAPRLPDLWISPRAADLARKDAAPGDPPPVLVGYQEPSLVFALGSDTQLLSAREAAEAGVANGGLALVEEREKSAFLARIAELEGDAQPVDALDGFNYSRGQKVHITLYRTQPHQPQPRVR
jgi:4-amino-4-deoxy-L-arabinose transferase-like glycosyltransferase